MVPNESASPTGNSTAGPPVVYTVVEVARILRIDPETVRRNAHRGYWPCRKFGPKTIRFTCGDLSEILELVKPAPPAPPVERRIGTSSRRRKAGTQ
ncbi:helix-turn-helix domain-containing protein [Arthrobacter silviterrae]|uniref:Helix-turn-helix domain-containing protein n=1 Tax=Arthrobacter silviterrae TaxID=2026658 RepID=A0ABX0D8D8_9MICC|nr:helix-turn-helix domain-containing protein [Arthrobacter silviterrae]